MKNYKIFVDDEVIYTGVFTEVPENYRENLISCLDDWSAVLSKKSINELLYSLFYWYYQKKMYCSGCKNYFEADPKCEECDLELTSRFIHERNPDVDKILDCIGMITRVEVPNMRTSSD
ncbi:MAG: hypothetical protein GWM89_05130 [Candidatus Dadabacteria bacterium]|nr:hypothetical protein [Candidatus Dadabacteria bacterium]NIV41594.1 hypothetical protein [Candidatus Dadabacteria bacterium]NIX15156.1 hypothetical protein [Candidatus Dadabacteria bacterium]NIY21801.1 hypothetical protein [Candidatus Dadabacteria bacterium]